MCGDVEWLVGRVAGIKVVLIGGIAGDKGGFEGRRWFEVCLTV